MAIEVKFGLGMSLEAWLDPATRQKVGIWNGEELRSAPLTEAEWRAALDDGWVIRYGGPGWDDSVDDGGSGTPDR